MTILDDLFRDACAWQRQCGACAHVLKSADDSVWRCSLFRAGRHHYFAISARDDQPHLCGIEARLFKPNDQVVRPAGCGRSEPTPT